MNGAQVDSPCSCRTICESAPIAMLQSHFYSPLADKTLRDADIGRRTGVMVMAVKRADGRVEFPQRRQASRTRRQHRTAWPSGQPRPVPRQVRGVNRDRRGWIRWSPSMFVSTLCASLGGKAASSFLA